MWWIGPIILGVGKIIEALTEDNPAPSPSDQSTNLIADSSANAAKPAEPIYPKYTPVVKPLKPTCPECKTEYEAGRFFCKNDGERLLLP